VTISHSLDMQVRPLRAPRPLRFPEEDLVPETTRHLELRMLLFAVLKLGFSDRAGIGSEQFVYFDASEPSRCLAPDAFLRFGAPHAPFGSWKTWERGAPELAVEIVSDSDAPQLAWERKLERYHAAGVEELLRFDPDAAAGERLRAWDRVQGDLVEREVRGDTTPCRTLDLWWVVCPALGFEAALRLARDAQGRDVLPTREEAAERREEAEAGARVAAERRVAELEAELRRRGGK
jgi:hypothetical protein